jgi:hypothetical protein
MISMQHIGRILACCALLAACSDKNLPPPANAVRFKLDSKTGGPLLVSARNVEAWRKGGAVVVNFDTIYVGRPRSETREVAVKKISLRVTDKDDRPVGAPDEKRVDVKLNDTRPIAEIANIRLRAKDAAAICETGCLVSAAAEMDTGTIVESEPVELRLGAGKVAATAAPADPRDSRCPLTAARASQAIGQEMRYQEIDATNDCGLSPVSPVSTRFIIVVSKNDPATVRDLTQSANAEIVTLGDRAVFVPPVGPNGTGILATQKNEWTVKMTMFAADRSAGTPAQMRQKETEIVGRLIEKL